MALKPQVMYLSIHRRVPRSSSRRPIRFQPAIPKRGFNRSLRTLPIPGDLSRFGIDSSKAGAFVSVPVMARGSGSRPSGRSTDPCARSWFGRDEMGISLWTRVLVERTEALACEAWSLTGYARASSADAAEGLHESTASKVAGH